jgi:hypothetical protein
MTVVLNSRYFSPFSLWKIKLKGRYFGTVEVMEAESQTVLNTLTEYNFQDVFKKWQKLGNGAVALKETISRVMLANRSKVNI